MIESLPVVAEEELLGSSLLRHEASLGKAYRVARAQYPDRSLGTVQGWYLGEGSEKNS
jgi:hypothetical protein